MSNRERDRSGGAWRAGAGVGRSRPGRARRPGLEALESRRLLTAVSEFPLRNVGAPSAYITLGPDGALWFTEASNNIGRIDPATGVTTAQYPIPSPNAIPTKIISGPGGKLWFVESALNQFGVVDPATGRITEVPVLPAIAPAVPPPVGAPQIQGLAAGPDGNIWFTESNANKIGVINPTTHAVQEFAVNGRPYGIARGPDGNLWFTEAGSNRVGMINPTTHAVADFPVTGAPIPQLRGIAVGSDNNLYFAMAGTNQIGRINPTTHAVATFAVPTAGAGPLEVAPGPDRRLWFTEPGSAQDRVGALDVSTGTITEYASFFQTGEQGIVDGGDGNLWVSQTAGSGVGKISTSGAVAIFSVPSSTAGAPSSVQVAGDGSLWFVESGFQLGMYDPTTHNSVQVALPPTSLGYQPAQLAVNPNDGSLWFTENGRGGGPLKIGRIAPGGAITDNRTGPTNGVGGQGIAFNAKYGVFYFAESIGNRLGTVNPSDGTISEAFPTLAAGSNPYGVVANPVSGKVWFTENGTGKVGVFDPSAPQTVSEIALPAGSSPRGIVIGTDGNIWVAETAGGSRGVAVIDPNTMQVIRQIAAPANEAIANGPDGNIWFSEDGGVGRIVKATYVLTAFPATDATPGGVATGQDGNLYFTGVGTGSHPGVIGSVDLAPSATASLLHVTTQPPSGVAVGQGFGLIVAVESAPGQADTFYNGPVTIALGANPGGATLSGNRTATAVNGVAVFPGLTLDRRAFGDTIVATVPGLPSVASAPFKVTQLDLADGMNSDFDGDGKADPAVFGRDPATGRYRFKVVTSTTGFDPSRATVFDNGGIGFGNAQSIPVPGDYFGDGRSAYALWYPNSQGGMTFTAVSSVTGRSFSVVNYGGTRDLPVVADVDGDGKADFGVYGLDSNYRFDFLLSSKNFDINQQLFFNNGAGYGNAQSIPVVADFDGSGKAGFGLYVPSVTGSFFTYVSQTGSSFTRTIGGPNDIPSAIEYDNDGKADLALYGPGSPRHYRYTVLTSGSGYDPSQAASFDNYGNGYGNATSVPVVADFEGTGRADFALFIPNSSNGMQYVYQRSQAGAGVFLDFATVTDLPLSAPTYLNARRVRGS